MIDLFSLSKDELESYRIVEWGYTEVLEPITYKEFLHWIEKGHHGPLNYLADERKDKRKSLKEVYPDCESALVFLFNYTDLKKSQVEQNPKFKIASYTTGFDDQDYHFWIKEKLEKIGESLKGEIFGLEYGISLDVHPVLERDLAQRAGLGWFGKNSMIINRIHGSYTLIGSLLLNKRLNFSSLPVEPDHCGTCTRCIEACPTNAIDEGMRTVDSNLCISTFTIETFKDKEPPKGFPTESSEIFGCDICQEVCPWNRKPLKNAISTTSSELVDFFNRDLEDIYYDIGAMSNKQFKNFFKRTSFERGGKRALLKNLKYYLKS